MFNSDIKISVIICTYNRCESLRITLDSLLQQRPCNKFSYEIIVVDNNSSDQTKETVASFESKFSGKLRYAFEPNQGLSFARNKGICESRGEIVAFTDDDVTAFNDWLENIYLTFQAYNAECVFGKILPLWANSNVPSWLKFNKFLWGKLAILDYGDEIFYVTSEEKAFFGANFAISKKTLNDIGQFNVTLGRSGNKLLAGEDTDLLERLISADKTIMYSPKAVIYHRIGAERMTKAYFRRWFYFSAQSLAESFGRIQDGRISIPGWFIKRSINELFAYVKSLVSLNEIRRLNCELKVIFNASLYRYSIKSIFKNAKN